MHGSSSCSIALIACLPATSGLKEPLDHPKVSFAVVIPTTHKALGWFGGAAVAAAAAAAAIVKQSL